MFTPTTPGTAKRSVRRIRASILLKAAGRISKPRAADVFLEPGNVYLIPTGLLYDFEGSPSVQKLFFHINLFKPDGFDLMLSCKQIASLPYSKKQTEELHKLYESDRFADMVLLKGRIAGVVSDMIEAYKIGFDDNDRYTPLVQNAMKYIRANLSVKLNISQVAEHGFVSVSTLTKAFKEQDRTNGGAVYWTTLLCIPPNASCSARIYPSTKSAKHSVFATNSIFRATSSGGAASRRFATESVCRRWISARNRILQR